MANIRTVTVRRFKQLEEVCIDLEDITLLIGANNSGKSSVLQALHFAVAIAQTARLVGEGVGWANDSFQLSFNPSQLLYAPIADVMSLARGGRLQEAAGGRIEIDIVDSDGHRCVVGLRRGRNRNIAVSIDGRELGMQLMNFERPFTVYAPGLAGVSREESFRSPGAVRRIVARGDANLVLRNVLLMLSRDEPAWATFMTDMQAVFPGIRLSIDFNEDTDEGINAYFRMPGGAQLPIDAAGTSILQASQILAYIGLFRPRVLILDEPDSHLHPNNQRTLCDLIKKMAPTRNFQALLSTHSRHVLDAMRNHCAVYWLCHGQKVVETDRSTTEQLLDLGALDSVDYFANGELRCVVASEDSDTEPLKALLWSSGFLEDRTEVATYNGCAKIDSAKVLGGFLHEKAPQVRLIVHLDRDYLSDLRATRFNANLAAAGVGSFITEFSDVEGSYLNSAHIQHLNPALSIERVSVLLDQATLECRAKSIEAMVNQRTAEAFQARRDGADAPNHGAIATQAIHDYDSDPVRWRRGKTVVGRLTALLQQELGNNPRIYAPSPHLRQATLEAEAARLWPPA